MKFATTHRPRRAALNFAIPLLGMLAGCSVQLRPASQELTTRSAIERYRASHAERLAKPHAVVDLPWDVDFAVQASQAPVLTFGSYPSLDQQTPSSQPNSGATRLDRLDFAAPDGYWRDNLLRQAGSEIKMFATRDFWRGYKTAFWDVENALFLSGAMGAGVAMRETGVDRTIRGRVRGHRQLGDLGETLQILGHPGTHFAGAGVLWLTSALTEDFKQHEVSKKLTQALAVNGVTTLLLKASANTRGPDGDRLAWPSGHSSSAFTVAAVINEYYGPLAGIPSLALAGFIGYQRIDSRRHDFSDVIFGGMLGYIIGSSIARDGKAEFPEIFGMTLIPYSDPQTGAAGLALMKQF